MRNASALLVVIMIGCGAGATSNDTAPPHGSSDAGVDPNEPAVDAGSTTPTTDGAATDAPPAPKGHAVDGTHASGAITYDYQLWIPGSYVPGTPTPMVVALHGCGQKKGDLAKLSRLNEEADRRGFLVLYPQQSQLANPGQCWNTSYLVNQERDSGELGVVMGMLGAVRQGYAVDDRRVYVLGLSAGAAMASNLAACYMDVFAAAGVIAGPMYKGAVIGSDAALIVSSGSPYDPRQRGRDAWNCSRKTTRAVGVMNVQGTADKLVAARNAEQVLTQFAVANDLADDGLENGSVPAAPTQVAQAQVPGGYAYKISTYEKAGAVLVEGLLVDGMDHTWSGGDPNATAFGGMMGGDAKGPVITPMLFDFFAQHQH